MNLNPFKLGKDELKTIRDLAKKTELFPAKGQRLRMGANGMDNPSVYNYRRWFDMPALDRKVFRDTFPEEVKPLILVGHFLEIPKEDGMLDEMVQWVGCKQAGYMVSINIGTAAADVYISGEKVSVPAGGSIAFSLAETHEIKPSKKGSKWACVMCITHPTEWDSY